MTFLGWIFIPLGIGILLRRPRWLLPLAIVAAVFQGGSVLNIGAMGIQPFYFVSILIACYLLFARLKGQLRLRVPTSSCIYPLLLFWLWAAVSAFVMPFVFRGTPVLDLTADMENSNFPVVPLGFSFANVTQVGWLTLNLGVVLFAALFGKWEQVRKALAIAVGIAVTIMLVQLALAQFGYQLPVWLFNNNPGQLQAILGDYDRPNGAFSEPSYAGVLFTSLTAGALARFFSGGSLWPFLGSLVCTLLVRSGASLAALVVCAVLLCATRLPKRKLGAVTFSAWKYAILGFLCLAGIAIAVEVPSISEALAENTVRKAETASFVVRAVVDLAGLTTFRNTYGLGVGLGSIRTSSFLVTLLAATGPGAALFIWFVIRLLRRTKNSALRWMFIGTLLTQVAGVPDLGLTLLWMNVCVLMVYILNEAAHNVDTATPAPA